MAQILDLKPDPKSPEFMAWIEEARKSVCELLAVLPALIHNCRSSAIVTHKFEKPGHPIVEVTIGYGVNGVMVSKCVSGGHPSPVTASRVVDEEEFFKSPYGTMRMEAQWFWRVNG